MIIVYAGLIIIGAIGLLHELTKKETEPPQEPEPQSDLEYMKEPPNLNEESNTIENGDDQENELHNGQTT